MKGRVLIGTHSLMAAGDGVDSPWGNYDALVHAYTVCVFVCVCVFVFVCVFVCVCVCVTRS